VPQPPAPVAPPAPAAPTPPAAPAPVAKAPKPEKVKEPTCNGLTRPAKGSLTRAVWDLADLLTAAKGGNGHASRKEVVDAAVAGGTNSSTATTQYGRWCKFSGYTEPRAPKQPAASPAAPVAPPAAPVAPAAAEPTPADVPAYPPGYVEGYNGYRAAVGGAAVTNPFTEGTTESTGFTQGWTDAAAQHQAGTLVL
jgi:translation initiation factor IF-2